MREGWSKLNEMERTSRVPTSNLPKKKGSQDVVVLLLLFNFLSAARVAFTRVMKFTTIYVTIVRIKLLNATEHC